MGFGTATAASSAKAQPSLTQGGWVQRDGLNGLSVWPGEGLKCVSGSLCRNPNSTKNIQCAGCSRWCHLECATGTVAGFKCMFCYHKYSNNNDALYD